MIPARIRIACPYWKTNLLLLRITKGSINKRLRSCGSGRRIHHFIWLDLSVPPSTLTFLQSPSLYHTHTQAHITSPLPSLFSFCFPTFHPSHRWDHCTDFIPAVTVWGHLGDIPAQSHRSQACTEPLAQPCNSQQLQNIELWHLSKDTSRTQLNLNLY